MDNTCHWALAASALMTDPFNTLGRDTPQGQLPEHFGVTSSPFSMHAPYGTNTIIILHA